MSWLREVRRGVSLYLILVGVVAHVTVLVGLVVVLNYFHLTPRQFVTKALEKSGLNIAWVEEMIRPAARFSGHQMDGRLRRSHPRILLPDLADWDGKGKAPLIRERQLLLGSKVLKTYNPCRGGGVMGLAACWLSNADQGTARRLAQELKAYEVHTPDASANYGNGWELAFAYDLLSLSPDFSSTDRLIVEQKIVAALKDYLSILDEDGPSLWHGRTSLASMAWICASVLDGSKPEHQVLISQAQGHFLDIVRAIELTEAWPEGYNYWINNRALVVVLSLGAYVNALEEAENKDRILAVVERVGLWHLYATRPDDRIEGLGDEGSRVDLKDETRRIIDLIAQLTRNSVFASYSNYLQRLHGRESYYRGYRWGMLLFNDPTLQGWQTEERYLESFKYYLPNADLFGQNAMGLAYIRSGWGKDDTFISFRSGHSMTHHGHYDAGHFSLFKGRPLAINSSVYGKYMGSNRLNYSLRTIAKNSLLILRPDENVKPNRFFEQSVAAGGQRITLPTGSTIHSTQYWYENLNSGQHLAGGEVRHFEHNYKAGYSYVSADLTAAYNNPTHDEGGRGGKVSDVQRSLLYLEDEDRLFVYDKVVTTEPEYTKKWLLHTVERPIASGLKVLVGSKDNGILQTNSNEISVANGLGHLKIIRHLPADGVVRLVGGTDYQYYVETDGDDSDLDGENFSQGAAYKPWFDVGNWRIEIQPQGSRLEDEFLVELLPSLGAERIDGSEFIKVKGEAKVLRTSQYLIIFASQQQGSTALVVPRGIKRLLVVGLQGDASLTWAMHNEPRQLRASSEGVFFLEEDLSEGTNLHISW